MNRSWDGEAGIVDKSRFNALARELQADRILRARVGLKVLLCSSRSTQSRNVEAEFLHIVFIGNLLTESSDMSGRSGIKLSVFRVKTISIHGTFMGIDFSL